jgi:hypothetical protein
VVKDGWKVVTMGGGGDDDGGDEGVVVVISDGGWRRDEMGWDGMDGCCSNHKQPVQAAPSTSRMMDKR